jgi:hypothetical protein
MKSIAKDCSQLISLACVVLIAGCGGNAGLGKKTMEIPELGVSMTIPDGWQTDNPQMCHKGDNTCLLMEEELEGKSFEQCATRISREFGTKAISENKLVINGCDAIQMVANTPSGDKLLRVYIHKGDKIIVLSFVILKDEYSQYSSAVQRSIQSIRIQP